MIGKLTGILDSIHTGHVILDVQGVGYLVYASRNTLSRLGDKGETVRLLIDTHVREDAITLYGFADEGEQQWFRLLNSVQGVGAKAAFAILAVCAPERLAVVITAQDKAVLTQADGVGPKLAARILTELKDKAGKIEFSTNSADKAVDKSVDKAQIPHSAGDSQYDNDAVSALVNLGYGRADAYSAVLKAKEQSNDNLQDLIRAALKELSA